MQNKTNKKEVNVAQRYFTQKKITVPEIIALTALGISLILFFIGKDEVYRKTTFLPMRQAPSRATISKREDAC